MNVSVSATRFF